MGVNKKKSGVHRTGTNLTTFQYCGRSQEGFKKENCKKCIELAGKKKNCLRCNKEFQPGCGAKFLCRFCIYNRPAEL